MSTNIFLTVFSAMLITLIFSSSWQENLISVATYTLGIYFLEYVWKLVKKFFRDENS